MRITRCPECGTLFQVSSKHLMHRGGKVRCGSCYNIFNAHDYLVRSRSGSKNRHRRKSGFSSRADVYSSPPKNALSSRVESLSTLSERYSTLQPLSQPPESSRTASASFLSSMPPSKPASDYPVQDVIASPALKPRQPRDPAAEIAARVRSERPIPSLLPSIPPSLPSLSTPHNPRPGEAAAFVEKLYSSAPVNHNTPTRPTEPLQGPPAEPSTETAPGTITSGGIPDWAQPPPSIPPAFSRLIDDDEEPVWAQPPQRPLSRWSLFIALLFLFVLASQTLYWFHAKVTSVFPTLKPWYIELGVDPPAAQRSDLIVMEGADLQADPQHQTLTLLATFSNRASFEQKWPLLELTLTDLNDAPIARRVFEVDQYLANNNPGTRLRAHQEVSVALKLAAVQPKPVGYQVQVFYP